MSDGKRKEHPLAWLADIGSQRIARVYAEALLNAAQRLGVTETVRQELHGLVDDLFASYPRLELFLHSGIVSRRHKAQVIRQALAGHLSPLVVNLLLVLNDHERLPLVRLVVRLFEDLVELRAGRLRMQIVSAAPLADDQAEKLRQELAHILQVEPILEQHIDPELLGGLQVRIRDWLFDGSLRTRLQRLVHDVMSRASYEIQSRRDRFCTSS